MRIARIAIVIFLLTLGACSSSSKVRTQAPLEDNRIMALALQSFFGGEEGFTVVCPDTTLLFDFTKYPEESRATMTHIKKCLKDEGYDMPGLVDKLYTRNRRPSPLSIQSSIENGYLIDYDRKYERYFQKDGGGWEQWYKENPRARGSTNISLPAYDEEKGIVLMYIGTQRHWLAGAGYVIVYRYQHDTLQELARIMLWIS